MEQNNINDTDFNVDDFLVEENDQFMDIFSDDEESETTEDENSYNSSISAIDYNTLNGKQLEAVEATEGYVRVIAGAGSGKTKALVSRYIYIVDELGISPSSILCVTFTNKAAQEMKNRVRLLLGNDKDLSYISTYHGFCVTILREDINKLFYPQDFIILDTEDQKVILHEIFAELNITSNDMTYRKIIDYIDIVKHKTPYVEMMQNTDEKFLINDKMHINEKIFRMYLKKQMKNYALDFNDLILFTLYIFKNNEDVLSKWQDRLHYVQVDEIQDSNGCQIKLLMYLTGKHENLFMVGDPDQAIYGWRGAKPEFLVNFHKKHPECQTIVMDENYRSTPEILSVGNSIIRHNSMRIDKNMFTQKKSSIKAIHFHGKSEIEESNWIVKRIKELQERNVPLKDIAILYRANHVSRYIEQVLIKNDIRYVIYGGIRFFERKEIKDALAYLRLIINGDDISFARVINYPRRGLGKRFMEELRELANETDASLYSALKTHSYNKAIYKKGAVDFINVIEKCQVRANEMSVSNFMQFVLDESGVSKQMRRDGDTDRIDNIKELLSSMITYENESGLDKFTYSDYLQEITLLTDLDYKEENDWVKLMTIHTAKGLEFHYVFLCAMTEGILPNHRALIHRKKEALEEERRLAYVAVTRAVNELYLTDSEGFNHDTGAKYPSRFLLEIKKDLLVCEGHMDEQLINGTKNCINKTKNLISKKKTSFKVSDLIKHPAFGNGKIISVNEQKHEYTIIFDNSKNEKLISMDFQKMVLRK